MYSFSYDGFDTTLNNDIFVTIMDEIGYNAYGNLVNCSPSYAFDKMCGLDDIFVFRGHANAGRIAFYDNNGSWLGRIAVNEYVSSTSNSCLISSCYENELASLRCVLYLGCNTGANFTHATGTYNLVEATYDKGAHFVLGTKETVTPIQSNAFLRGFLDELKNKSNVITCMQKGLVLSGGYPITYVGDVSQYLN